MKLILINGPCGVGKSSVASALHASMPLSYLLDVDSVMQNVSGYREPEHKEDRTELTHAIAKASVEAALSLGRDVIVEKLMRDGNTIDAYLGIAHERGAEAHETLLWARKDVVMRRANDRGWREGGLLTPEKCEAFWEDIDVLKGERKDATVIDTSDLSEQEVVNVVKQAIA